MSWLKAFNPTAPITTEAEAAGAARASAISIFIGVVVGIVTVVWTMMHLDAIQAAAVQAAGNSPDAAAAAAAGGQTALWMGGAMVVAQLIFGFIQWRSPNKFIAILFMVLIVLGILLALAGPMMASAMPNVPATPAWQIILSVVIMIVQLILHFAGLRGIRRLDDLNMAASR